MRLLYFHCVGGDRLVLDRAGSACADDLEIQRQIMRVAGPIMGRFDRVASWAGWLVHVQDDKGRLVGIYDFPQRPATGNELSAPVPAAQALS